MEGVREGGVVNDLLQGRDQQQVVSNVIRQVYGGLYSRQRISSLAEWLRSFLCVLFKEADSC